MEDLIVQFARLWGQQEVLVVNCKDEQISKMLKSYDSIELRNLLQQWSDEFMFDSNENTDTVEFFEEKIEEMYSNHCKQEKDERS